MGARSKSSNTTTNNVTNYSLQGMESAETVVAGDGNTVTTTDHGAVDGAFALGSEALGFAENAMEIGGEVINGNTEVSKLAINSNSDLAKDALKQGYGFGETAIEGYGELADSALKRVSTFGQSALDANSSLADSTLKRVTAFGESALDANSSLADSTLKRVTAFGESALDANNSALNSSFSFGETAIESNNEALQTGFGFAESLVQQNTANSAATNLAVKDLAKSLASNGASDITDLTTKTVYTLGAVIGIVLLGLFIMGGRK